MLTTVRSGGREVVVVDGLATDGNAAVGTGPAPAATARLVVVRSGDLEEASGEAAFAALERARTDAHTVAWVDLARAERSDVLRVAGPLDLHPLIVEDIEEGNQRSKVELTDGLIHLVVFALAYREEVVATEIDIVVGRGFVLTAHDGGWDGRGIPRLATSDSLVATMQRGPDHLLWAMVDAIVDDYFPFVDRLGDALDSLEDEVVARADPETLQRVFAIKRDLIAVRRAVSPVREILNQLTNRDLALIDPDEIIYFRDIYDHLIRLTDEIDTYRELAASTLDVYLSSVNNNLSTIMKRLTGVTVVLAGIGAVAGIFGMSEANAELGSGLGFWAVTALIAAGAAATLWALRRINWL